MAHGFGAGAGLPRAAAGKDEPDDPVTRRRRLIGASPERPVMEQLRAFERRHRLDELDAGAGREAENIAGPLDLCAGNGAGPPPTCAPGAGGGLLSAAHSAGSSDTRRAAARVTGELRPRGARVEREGIEWFNEFASVICAR